MYMIYVYNMCIWHVYTIYVYNICIIVNYSTLGFALAFECSNVWYRSCCWFLAQFYVRTLAPSAKSSWGICPDHICRRWRLCRWDPVALGSSCSPHDFDAQETLKMLKSLRFFRQRSARTSWMSSEFGINWSDLCRMWWKVAEPPRMWWKEPSKKWRTADGVGEVLPQLWHKTKESWRKPGEIWEREPEKSTFADLLLLGKIQDAPTKPPCFLAKVFSYRRWRLSTVLHWSCSTPWRLGISYPARIGFLRFLWAPSNALAIFVFVGNSFVWSEHPLCMFRLKPQSENNVKTRPVCHAVHKSNFPSFASDPGGISSKISKPWHLMVTDFWGFMVTGPGIPDITSPGSSLCSCATSLRSTGRLGVPIPWWIPSFFGVSCQPWDPFSPNIQISISQ